MPGDRTGEFYEATGMVRPPLAAPALPARPQAEEEHELLDPEGDVVRLLSDLREALQELITNSPALGHLDGRTPADQIRVIGDHLKILEMLVDRRPRAMNGEKKHGEG